MGFSGESKVTLMEVDLAVYAEGIDLNTMFLIINADSADNVILGRPWIHELHKVPSTYHQLIKFLTPWGCEQSKGSNSKRRNAI